MATDLNMWQGIGRLGKDVEIRFTATGDAVANFSLACGWKSKEKEGTEWVNITAFGKLAEICGKYLKKGSQVYIAGSLKTDKYTDKSGVEKYSTKVMAEKMQMLGSKQEDGEQPPNNAKLLATAKQELSYADIDNTPF
jgi:single-strand DNA-binding protein